MKTIIRYFSQSAIEVILLLVFIALIIKMYKDEPLLSAMLGLFITYILSVIFRIGQLLDTIDNYVSDVETRLKLGFGMRIGSIVAKRKKTILEKIVKLSVWLFIIAMLTAFVFDFKFYK